MKYTIWQVKRIDYLNMKTIDLEQKINRNDDMFMSPDGKFMTWGCDGKNPILGDCYIMEQDSIYFELEIIE